MISRSRDFRELPINILWCAIFLNIMGLVVLKSIAQHSTGGMLQNPFLKQILFLIPAVFLCTLIFYTPRSFVHKYSYTLYCLGIILVLLPFLGERQAGTYRWLYVGLPFNVQPSEFAKLFTVIALARYLSDHNLKLKNFT